MTAAIDITVHAAIVEARRLEAHPRAHPHVTTLHCGGGIPQPGWPECHRTGAWRIDRQWDAQYHHDYCGEHAVMRIQADDRMYGAAP